MAQPNLTDVRGIGPTTAEGLATLGIDTIGALIAAPNELIASLPGFHVNRAQAAKDAAAELLRGTEEAAAPAAKPKTKKTKPTKKALKKPGKKKSGTKPAKKKDKNKKAEAKGKKKGAKKDKKKPGKKKPEKKSAKKQKKKKKAKK
ncbi:MAG: helix-hairpin-helix domain-containing protein [Thermoanaerobaculales bacterium]|nr:helix-hairpin-helix domain-containing protein [Thermoanaerobaculales bacterium]